MKIVPVDQNGILLPDNLNWISLSSHPFKDLLQREVFAIEEEIKNLELVKKTITKRCKEEKKNHAAIKSLYKAVHSSSKDVPSKRVQIFKTLKKIKPDNNENSHLNVQAKGKEGENGEEDEEHEMNESNSGDEIEVQIENDEEVSGKEEHKKRKYNITVKKCECCGLEVKRHNCKHLLCIKPCFKEEKQQLKKKEKKDKSGNNRK